MSASTKQLSRGTVDYNYSDKESWITYPEFHDPGFLVESELYTDCVV